jgi:hypothetical protein
MADKTAAAQPDQNASPGGRKTQDVASGSTSQTVSMSDSPEPRAGYYVASQSRPALVTSLTSAEITDVFDLVEEVYGLPSNGNGHNGNGSNGHTPH